MVLTFLYCGPDQVVHGGSSTETIGTLVDKDGKAVPGATVDLFISDKQSAFMTTVTNSTGEFKFDSIPANTYTVIGTSNDGNVVFIEPFVYDSSIEKIKNLGVHKIYPPGVISGCIQLPTNYSSADEASIYIPGTSFSVRASNNENFIMPGIPKGNYSLKVSLTGYSIKTLSSVNVVPNETTHIDSCTTLELDPALDPSPILIDIKSNEIAGTVAITWHKVPVNDLKEYVVYRATNGDPKKIGGANDTFYIDNVFNPSVDTSPVTLSYQVTSKDNGNRESKLSDQLTKTVYPPYYYRCTYSGFNYKSVGGSDTVTNAATDTALITVSFENRKRKPINFIWFADSIQNESVTHTDSGIRGIDSVYRGTETFKHRWNTSGTKDVFVKSIDDHGDVWVSTFHVDIVDSSNFHIKGKWTYGNSMGTKRRDGCAAVLDSVIYYIGGGVKKHNLQTNTDVQIADSSVEQYDLRTGNWSQGIALPDRRYWSSAITLNNKIYVIGGYNEKKGFLSSIYSYTPGVSAWKLCGNLPCGLYGMSACSYESKIIIVGGTNEEDVSNVILTYDPVTQIVDTLDIIDETVGQRTLHQSVIYNDNLYIIGGTDLVSVYSDVIVYNLKAKTITGTFPVLSRYLTSAWCHENYLYIAGGANDFFDNMQVHNDVEYVDLNNVDKNWVTLQSLSKPVYGAVSVFANNGLFLIGGATGNGTGQEINSVQIYYP